MYTAGDITMSRCSIRNTHFTTGTNNAQLYFDALGKET